MNAFNEHRREQLVKHLRGHVEGEVRFDPVSRKLYSTDASIYLIEPLGVVIPKSAADIVAVVGACVETGVPITARGGGTSLSGQSIGPGVVLDCSKYLNRVLEIDPTARTARIQPGVVLDTLNRELEPDNLLFGPEVSTSSRANLGGMIGNNSAGSRSIVYGKTIDHVKRLRTVLTSGEEAEFGPVGAEGWDRESHAATFRGGLYRQLGAVVRECRDEIRKRFPRIIRRVSGYNLDVLCEGLTDPASPRAADVGLHHLLVGSEGTLGVTTEAELNLLPRPKARGLLVPQFATLAAAMDAVAVCLELKPSAVEVLDRYLLELTAGNLALRDATKFITGKPQAVFMVEFSSDDPAEVADNVEKLRRKLEGVAGVTAQTPALDPAIRDPLWNLRRASMPLLYSMPGDRKPVTFIEDAAVPTPRLPEFVARFREILRRHGTDGAFYGHASVGCLHIRPVLNLKDPEQVERMRKITDEVTDLVLVFGGSLSGEHGDGLARSEWNPKMFGPVVYEAFRRVKGAFDPKRILNPGRVVDAPRMTENLRYPPGYRPHEPETVFDYAKQEGFVRAVEMCNGSGACRKTQGGTMCPSFRATRDERDSTRGRANILRLALAGEQPERALRGQQVHQVFDLCLECKACKSECPSSVDVAKLKAEFLHLYYRGKMRPLGHLLMGHIHLLNRMGAPFAPVVNWVQRRGLVRWLLELLGGLDARRTLPVLHADHARRWFARHAPAATAGRAGRVLLLDDCFTTFNEPAISRAAVRVLERAGYAVQLAGLHCCGRALISKGFLDEAQRLVKSQAPALAQRIAEGAPLVGLEPSCLLTIADEWTELWPGPVTRSIADACHLADGWLATQVKEARTSLELEPLASSCIVHGHCHQKALVGTKGTEAALHLIPELKVEVLDTGCCGMAGSFGYERDHYDLSVKVAELSVLPALASAPDATVIAPGTSCRHQIHDLADRRALHPLELLAEQLSE